MLAIDSDEKGSSNYGFRELTVDASDVEGITIGITRGKRKVNGILRAEDGAKRDLSHLYVVLIAEDSSQVAESYDDQVEGGSGYSRVMGDGSFQLELIPGSKRMYAMVGARGTGFEDWYTSQVLWNGKDVLESGFRPGEAAQGRLEIVLSANGGSIAGTALDADKKPFPGAHIVALPSDPKLRARYDLMQSTTADQQGKFKLRGIRPGEYMVMALEDAQEPFAEAQFLNQNAEKIRTITVGQSPIETQLQMIPVAAP